MQSSSAFPFSSPVALADWLREYRGDRTAYDEYIDPSGAARPKTAALLETLQKLDSGSLHERWREAQRTMAESGLATAGSIGSQHCRPWPLDPFPCLLSPETWAYLQEGLRERGDLYQALLTDMYGEQRALREGILPMPMLAANPLYVRPAWRQSWEAERPLWLFACDIARHSDGSWQALGGRSQSPAGLGYALENRLMTAEIFREAFHNCRVTRLANFFMGVRDALYRLAPAHRQSPRIVMLTAGPGSPTYPEVGFMARYLGISLVQGNDLTVRATGVYLKALDGLQQVDVILRRLDDAYCDPLELKADSLLGVPGLLGAVRQGQVTLVNPVGVGFLETPALQAILPRLANFYLGKDLHLAEAEAWWCGDDGDRRYVLEHLPELFIREAFSPGDPGIAGAALSEGDRADLAAGIAAKPWRYMAMRMPAGATAPVLCDDHQLQPNHCAIRCFVGPVEGGGWRAMPGGFVRCFQPGEPLDMQSLDGVCKDLWVLAAEDIEPVSLLPRPDTPEPLRRSGVGMTSRAADDLYWMGRYIERAEVLVRLLRTIASRLMDETLEDDTVEPVLRELLPLLGYTLQPEPPPELPFRQLIDIFVHDETQPFSVVATASRILDIGAKVRDRMSPDTWRHLWTLRNNLTGASGDEARRLTALQLELNHLLLHIDAFTGSAHENMTREPGWRFLVIGRRLERAVHTLALLRAMLANRSDRPPAVLSALLDIADSSITYRTRYKGLTQSHTVLDLLLTDPTNPRGVIFQVNAIVDQVAQLPPRGQAPDLMPENRLAAQVRSRLLLADVTKLCAGPPNQPLPELASLLTSCIEQLYDLSQTISQAYLSHVPPQIYRSSPAGKGPA